jgi:radical SAM-linked protein
VVQRLRLRYAKRGRLRFTSHRDFQRSLERAVRRAGIPIAYSAGFSPHPRISYANAAPTGAASEAEYVELGLQRRCDPDQVRTALDGALPPGLDVVEVIEARTPGLTDRLEASVWLLELPGVAPAVAATALQDFLDVAEYQVQRMTKSGLRTLDARSAVIAAQVLGEWPGLNPGDRPAEGSHNEVASSRDRVAEAVSPDCAILQVVLRHLTPAVRPDDVLAALRSQADLAPPLPPRMTRLAQGPLDPASGAVADPLAADRDAGGA